MNVLESPITLPVGEGCLKVSDQGKENEREGSGVVFPERQTQRPSQFSHVIKHRRLQYETKHLVVVEKIRQLTGPGNFWFEL